MERFLNLSFTLSLTAMFVLVGCAFASGSDQNDVNRHFEEDVTLKEDMEGRNVRIDAEKNLRTENRIEAREDASLKSGGNTHIGGTIKAGRINIKAGGSVKLDGHIQGGDVNITSGGDMDLSNTIEANRVQARSGRNMNVDADITGQQGVDLTTEGDGRLWIKEDSILNAPQGRVDLRSNNLQMEGTIHDETTGEK